MNNIETEQQILMETPSCIHVSTNVHKLFPERCGLVTLKKILTIIRGEELVQIQFGHSSSNVYKASELYEMVFQLKVAVDNIAVKEGIPKEVLSPYSTAYDTCADELLVSYILLILKKY